MTHISEPKEAGLVFEIVSARINDQEEKKYVVYTLQIRRISGTDDMSPSVIDRRYTDFLNLHTGLKKEHPQQMTTVTFPRKALWGNFDNELISARSTEFETLLKSISSDQKLRVSNSLLHFLQDCEIRVAKEIMRKGNYSEALPQLESIFRLVNKVFTDRSPGVLIALCRLLACSILAGDESSEKWAELALHRYEGVSDSDLLELYIPLLQTCLPICKNRNEELNERIEALKKQGYKFRDLSLLEAVKLLEERLFVGESV